MDSTGYSDLLQRRKEMALVRQQEDLERIAQEQKEDSICENNRDNSLLNLDRQLQAHRQNQISESLQAVQSLKSKHEQEFAALEERHKAEAVVLKENIERKERDLEDNFNKQYVVLHTALTQADNKRMENRRRAKVELQGKRCIEDMSLGNEVFSVFEKEALASSVTSRERSSFSPEPIIATPEERVRGEREKDARQYLVTYSPRKEMFKESRSENLARKVAESEYPSLQQEHCDLQKSFEDLIDVKMVGSFVL